VEGKVDVQVSRIDSVKFMTFILSNTDQKKRKRQNSSTGPQGK